MRRSSHPRQAFTVGDRGRHHWDSWRGVYMSTLQVTPDASFSLNWTASAIFIVVLGGIGTIEGPVIGTAVYFALRETSPISEPGTLSGLARSRLQQ